jgi:FtsH-binding integral membrane protein
MTDEFNPTNPNPSHQPANHPDRSAEQNQPQPEQSERSNIQPSATTSEAFDQKNQDLTEQQSEQQLANPPIAPAKVPAKNEFLGFRLIGYGLLALALLDLAHAAIPPRFMNPAWELEMIESLAARVPMIFVGLIMVLYQKRAPTSRLQLFFSRLFAWGIVVLASLYLLSIPLTVSNSLRQDNAYRNSIKSQLLQINNQTQELRDDLKQASDRDILNLLNQVENQELLGDAANPEEFKSQASEKIQQFDQEMQEQAEKILWQERINNIKNSLRLVLGGLVAGLVLLRIRMIALPKTRERPTDKDIRSLNLARLPGYGLLFLGLANYIITSMPPLVTNPNWGIFITSYVAELTPIPIIGLALIFYRSTQGRKRIERFVLKILSWFSLLAAIIFVLLVPVVIAYSIQQTIQSNQRMATQLEQETFKNNQLRDRIESYPTDEIAVLIEQQTLTAVPPASQDPEQLRILALADLEQRQQDLEQEIIDTKNQQNKFLLQNFFKRLAESIVLSSLFFYIWRATEWARSAHYGVIARKRRRPKGGKKGRSTGSGKSRRRK